MTTSTETKAEKRLRLAQLGYTSAGKPARCALCSDKVAVGQYLARMPASWQVSNPRRHAHRACYEKLQDWIRAKAAGEPVAPLVWAPRNANTASAPKRMVHGVTDADRAAAARYAGDGPRAAAWVAGYVSGNDCGPLWSELSRAMGWTPWRLTDSVIRDLAHAGWLSFSSETRSLRPGPAAGATTHE